MRGTMRPKAILWLVLTMLAGLLLAPVPVPAHSEGPGHGHPDQSQAAAKSSDSQTGMVKWMDDSGQVHYSQGLNSVPEQFRSRAVPLGQATPSSPQSSATK